MQQDDWKKFLEESKKNYFKIGAVPCSALGNELVYFNKYGFKHLIRKGRKYRESSEQIWRMKLLPYTISVLKNAKKIYTHKEDDNGITIAYFWEIRYKISVENNIITLCVILRKLGIGKLHFFSVFDR